MDTKYRDRLPQLNGSPFLMDGGLETTMIFHEGLEIPLFAAFTLIDSQAGREALDRYMIRYGKIAVEQEMGFIMDTPTWRASARWANDLGVSVPTLKDAHRQSIHFLRSLREGLETEASPFVLNGVLGPQDDGYNPKELMSVDKARAYHAQQVEWFKEFGADMVSAITMTYVDEALGIALAAKDAGMPSAVSFTVETDGRLPSGQPLDEAIDQVDAETGNAPAYYMINCAHPSHFEHVLEDAGWMQRVWGIRANASRCSHAELDEAEELDDGNPQEFGQDYARLRDRFPWLNVFGGCCGTDHRHIAEVARACLIDA